ncbi:hypothetical protein ACWD3Z_01885 [Streptomyces sp. NPDC002740]|uniref:hypothetical protein n=1 Tax=Streptomyces sp. NPDC002884 TaxID=3154544 RepID=UPI0033188346
MSELHASLSQLREGPGVSGVALVDAVTGLVYDQVGTPRTDGVECSELADLVGTGLHAAGGQGELESIVVTTASHHLVTRVLPERTDPLLLCVTLDRERANLALVSHRLNAFTTGASA